MTKHATSSPATPDAMAVSAVRGFNRFYTRQLGLLHERHLGSPYSLTQVRILYELAHHPGITASELSGSLGLDPSYLSRTLASFAKTRLIERRRSPDDGRSSLLRLTAKGRATFAPLNERAERDVEELLEPMSTARVSSLVSGMHAIERALDATSSPAFMIRDHHAGDLGWVLGSHAELYSREYGWGEPFEALVARVIADFVGSYDPARERCWIAERGGERVGSVFLVQQSKTIAKLRLLLVEPAARGLGVGRALVGECGRFARQVGYKRITLWTNDILTSARRIYIDEGYRLVSEEPNTGFGNGLIAQTWELDL